MKALFLSLLLATPLAAKPNIVFIFADDLGYNDLSCYGQKNFTTPHLDKLAASGIRFTSHYSGATVCAPSRCSLMTGKDGGHAAIRGNGPLALPESQTNVAEILKQAGYHTAMIGKSCVTGSGENFNPKTVLDHGFDYFYGTLDHKTGHFRFPKFVYQDTEKVEFPGNKLHTGTDYDATLYTNEALGYIEKQSPEKPFFLLLSYPIPHASVIAPEEERNGARPLVKNEVVHKGSKHYTNTPEVKANYIGMIEVLDDAVGSISAQLGKQGLLEDTLIVFSSDNGPHFEGGYHPDLLDSNGPLRGGKRDLYEGGIRIPYIISWPAAIKPGQTSDHPSAFWDFLPTVCEITDSPVPKNIQGISYAPTLLGDGEQKKHETLYWEFHEKDGRRALRQGDWKLVQYNLTKPDKLTTELFLLSEDLGEDNDLSKKNPEKLAELLTLIEAARVPSTLFPYPALDK